MPWSGLLHSFWLDRSWLGRTTPPPEPQRECEPLCGSVWGSEGSGKTLTLLDNPEGAQTNCPFVSPHCHGEQLHRAAPVSCSSSQGQGTQHPPSLAVAIETEAAFLHSDAGCF